MNAMTDLRVPPALANKMRREWGDQPLGLSHAAGPRFDAKNGHRLRMVRQKIANFVSRAVYPQQLTIPRQYATTQEGVFIYKIIEGREIDGIREQGVRVVVQENARQARFVMSPLFSNRHDALAWARRNMGVS